MRQFLHVLVVVASLVCASGALAHPLGNFTVNRHSEVVISGDRAFVKYVLDLAEIPAFQERAKIGDGADYRVQTASRLADGLHLDVGGTRVPLVVVESALQFPPGQGGLVTLRLELLLESGRLGSGDDRVELEYRDTNFADRIGWREIVIAEADGGARVLATDVARSSTTDSLRSYPESELRSPMAVNEAHAEVILGSGDAITPSIANPADAPQRPRSATPAERGFAKLIEQGELSVGFMLVSLAVAMFWGAAHALSPGHGKALVGAYLIGARGRARHAFYLGGIVTITHTLGVFALGFITLLLSELIVPERLYPWLNLVAALLVVGVGLVVARPRIQAWRADREGEGRPHDHGDDHAHGDDHGHSHSHPHGHDQRSSHSHLPEPGTGVRGLFVVGVSGGLVPCPTALVVMLAAISLHRVAYGMVLIVAFSLGLAATMTLIGLVALYGRRLFERASQRAACVGLLPALSALGILGLGVFMTLRAIPELA